MSYNQNAIDNIDRQIEDIERRSSSNYGNITPIERERIKININRLKIQKMELICNDIRNSRASSPLEGDINRLEFQKYQLLANYYRTELQISDLKIRSYQR